MNDINHRHSMRLARFKYDTEGAYFVTICVQGRKSLFGTITDRQMVLNDAGQMIDEWWKKLPRKFAALDLDVYVIMPDHFHGLLWINDSVGATPRGRPPGKTQEQNPRRSETLFFAMGWFKTMTTNRYIHGVRESNFEPFSKRLWQRIYYDRIIRDGRELSRVRDYIVTNPTRCHSDKDDWDMLWEEGDHMGSPLQNPLDLK